MQMQSCHATTEYKYKYNKNRNHLLSYVKTIGN